MSPISKASMAKTSAASARAAAMATRVAMLLACVRASSALSSSRTFRLPRPRARPLRRMSVMSIVPSPDLATQRGGAAPVPPGRRVAHSIDREARSVEFPGHMRERTLSITFGIFDHVDRGAGPLADFYENRLKLVEGYDRAGF